MKYLLMIFLFVPVLGWGQDDLYGPKEKVKPAEPFVLRTAANDSVPSWVYCQIVGTGKLFSNSVNIVIDYGQHRKFFSDQRVRDEDGKVKDFNSMVDAMNYMGAKGWEFVQAYTITLGNSNVYHFLLRADLRNPVFLPEVKKK